MICIGILDDESQQRELLQEYLAKFVEERGERVNLDVFGDSQTFLEQKIQYDILLLDIFLGKNTMNGMELASEIRKQDPEVLILFVTNMANYAIQGYSVNAFDFLVKPVSYDLFRMKMNRAFERLESRNRQMISLRTAGGMKRLNIRELVYVEVQGHNLIYHMTQESITVPGTMAAAESILADMDFFRCHVAFLVNMHFVEKVDGMTLTAAGEQIPVSKHRKKEFMAALADALGGELI